MIKISILDVQPSFHFGFLYVFDTISNDFFCGVSTIPFWVFCVIRLDVIFVPDRQDGIEDAAGNIMFRKSRHLLHDQQDFSQDPLGEGQADRLLLEKYKTSTNDQRVKEPLSLHVHDQDDPGQRVIHNCKEISVGNQENFKHLY